ncbi:MAG: amidohydrolase family protein [Ignavibacteriae bacterium]|nr:amidohydrolase family protein [Ignavibacteriota bacterium]
MKLQIINGKILVPSGVVNSNLEIEDGVITSVSDKIKKDNSAKIIDAKNKFILPGFIDLHTNGIAGFDLTNGLYNSEKQSFSIIKEDYLNGIETSLKAYAKRGTTLVGFTTLEASIKKMKKIFQYIAEFKDYSNSKLNDIFYGIYMEGTFMKDKKFKGAHDSRFFFEPSIKLFNEFQKAAKGNIKIVNVVPEWGKPALKLIEYLNKQNVNCAAGHTGATGNEYSAAIKKGLNLAIHVLNGPSSTSYKPFDNGGALEAFLTSEKMFLEIIPDGYHVSKSYILDIIKRKGIDKCIAISDSMFSTNMKGVKQFKINNVKGRISNNGEYIHIVGKENMNSLFGSTLTMDKAFANLLTWFTQSIVGVWNKSHEPLSFESALVNASKMCSENPAKLLGIYSNEKSNQIIPTGSIEVGKRADIILSEITKNRKGYKINISKVFLKGVEI